MAYESAELVVVSEKSLREADSFKVYEMEEDVTQDLTEFSIANAVFAALVEGHASEISARRNAMDNATKVRCHTMGSILHIAHNPYCPPQNANDMIAALQLKYNRGRQASITNDLVDIITGMLAWACQGTCSSCHLPRLFLTARCQRIVICFSSCGWSGAMYIWLQFTYNELNRSFVRCLNIRLTAGELSQH